MKRRILFALLTAAVSVAPLRADTAEEAAARSGAYSVAGAFTNDGFKLRDGHWNGRLEVGKPRVVQVNLYAGNQYWFTLGATAGGKKVTVTVYDESGKAMPSQPYADEGKAAAGFSPGVSGPYFVKVEETEGEPCTFCLLYSYK